MRKTKLIHLTLCCIIVLAGCAIEEEPVSPPDPRTFNTEFSTNFLPTVADNLETATLNPDQPYVADESARQAFVAFFREYAEYFQDWDDESGWELSAGDTEGTWRYESSGSVPRRWRISGNRDIQTVYLEVDYNGDGSFDSEDYPDGIVRPLLWGITAGSFVGSRGGDRRGGVVQTVFIESLLDSAYAHFLILDQDRLSVTFDFTTNSGVVLRASQDGSTGSLSGRTSDTGPVFRYDW